MTFTSVQVFVFLNATEVHLTHAEASDVLIVKNDVSVSGFSILAQISQSSRYVSVFDCVNVVNTSVVLLFNLTTELSAKIISADHVLVIILSLSFMTIEFETVSIFQPESLVTSQSKLLI